MLNEWHLNGLRDNHSHDDIKLTSSNSDLVMDSNWDFFSHRGGRKCDQESSENSLQNVDRQYSTGGGNYNYGNYGNGYYGNGYYGNNNGYYGNAGYYGNGGYGNYGYGNNYRGITRH